MMINAMNAIMRKPEFTKVDSNNRMKADSDIRKPRDEVLMNVLRTIKVRPDSILKIIYENSNYGYHCIRMALRYMVSEGIIIKTVNGQDKWGNDLALYRALK